MNQNNLIKDNECLEDLQYKDLYIIQEKTGYRFTSDAIALANFVKLPKSARLVDMCSGSGVIGLLAHYKNNAKETILVEIQESLADMSRRTLEYNSCENIEVVNKQLQGVHKIIGGVFDAVVCNPPYKKVGTAGQINENQSIAIARHEIAVTLEEIVAEAAKLLKFGGDFYTVNKEERLADLIVYLRKYGLEPKEIKILPSSSGANVFMLKAKKGGKSGLKILLD